MDLILLYGNGYHAPPRTMMHASVVSYKQKPLWSDAKQLPTETTFGNSALISRDQTVKQSKLVCW